MTAGKTARWWRRNGLALAAVVVLLPLTAAAVGANEWWIVNQSKPVIPTTVAAGESIDYAGATWGPVRLGALSADAAADVPSGARAIVVEVPVDPHGGTVACDVPTLRELSGDGRRWNNATSELDWRYDSPSVCPSDATAPFTIEVPYLMPDDAVGPFGLEFTLIDQLPGFLRLTIP